MPDDLRERIALAIEEARPKTPATWGVFTDGFDRGLETAARIARETPDDDVPPPPRPAEDDEWDGFWLPPAESL